MRRRRDATARRVPPVFFLFFFDFLCVRWSALCDHSFGVAPLCTRRCAYYTHTRTSHTRCNHIQCRCHTPMPRCICHMPRRPLIALVVLFKFYFKKYSATVCFGVAPLYTMYDVRMHTRSSYTTHTMMMQSLFYVDATTRRAAPAPVSSSIVYTTLRPFGSASLLYTRCA